MRAARVQDAKAKEKKQKIILAAGGVLLLALLAIQLPKLMKHGGGTPAAATTTATVVITATTPGDGTVAAPSSAQLTSFQNTDLALPTSADKLSSLSRFHTKDPFEQQATETTPDPAQAAAAGPVASSPAEPPAEAPVFGTVEGQPSPPKGADAPNGSAGSGSSDGSAAAKLPQATIRINGKASQVALGDSFPKASPAFRLAGFAPGSVQIVVVGGSLADDSTTLKLRRKHSVTLVNTVDGSRYTLELISVSRAGS